MGIESSTEKIEVVKKRIANFQDDYFEMLNESDDLERLKELQIDIINNVQLLRDLCMEEARQQLEDAFSPKLKSMISEKLQIELEKEYE